MRLYLALLLSIVIFGCNSTARNNTRFTEYDNLVDSGKQLSLGDDRDVYLFCDADNWKALKPFVQSSIEREVSLVYPEKYFNLILAEASEIERYSKHKNLVFIGDLESNGRISQHMRVSVAQDFISRVQQSGGDLFVAKNFASRDQITLYLMGSDPLKLSKIGAIQSDNLFSLLLKRFSDRLGYQTYQQKVIPASFFAAYPYSMQIPNNYSLYSNDREGNFMSLIYRAKMQDRSIPDKFISVYYEAMPENSLDLQWVIKKKQLLAQKYFEGDEFDVSLIRSYATKFAGFEAIKIIGAWKNPKHMIGGGFQCFAFWNNGNAYLVDNIVYFPAGDKLPILTELSVISSTLKIK